MVMPPALNTEFHYKHMENRNFLHNFGFHLCALSSRRIELCDKMGFNSFMVTVVLSSFLSNHSRGWCELRKKRVRVYLCSYTFPLVWNLTSLLDWIDGKPYENVQTNYSLGIYLPSSLCILNMKLTKCLLLYYVINIIYHHFKRNGQAWTWIVVNNESALLSLSYGNCTVHIFLYIRPERWQYITSIL